MIVEHVICQGNLSLLVSNDGELQVAARDLIDVFDPATVALNGVGGQADQLGTSSRKLGLQFGKGSEFGGAHGSVIFGVREKHDPVVANELVEVDGALGGVGLEVGRDRSKTEARERERAVSTDRLMNQGRRGQAGFAGRLISNQRGQWGGGLTAQDAQWNPC